MQNTAEKNDKEMQSPTAKIKKEKNDPSTSSDVPMDAPTMKESVGASVKKEKMTRKPKQRMVKTGLCLLKCLNHLNLKQQMQWTNLKMWFPCILRLQKFSDLKLRTLTWTLTKMTICFLLCCQTWGRKHKTKRSQESNKVLFRDAEVIVPGISLKKMNMALDNDPNDPDDPNQAFSAMKFCSCFWVSMVLSSNYRQLQAYHKQNDPGMIRENPLVEFPF